MKCSLTIRNKIICLASYIAEHPIELVGTYMYIQQFNVFPRYMYYEKATLNDTTAISLYYASSKFKVSALQELCSIYIRENIHVDVDNVCEMLDKSTIFKCHHFSEQCLGFIDGHPGISQTDDFKNLSKPVLYGAMLYLDNDGLKEQFAATEKCEDLTDQNASDEAYKANM